MPNIPQVVIGSTTYNLKDAGARDAISELKDTINVYDGITPLISGYMNTHGNIVENTERMTTGLIHVHSPFTVSVNPGYQLGYCVGDAAPYTDKSWVILDGGSIHIDINEGSAFGFNIARTDHSYFTQADNVGFSLVFDECNHYKANKYDGVFQLMSGYISTNRLPQANDKRATTGIFYADRPITLSVDSGWQLLVLAGDKTGNLTDKGWVIVGGGSYRYDLSNGKYVALTLAKTNLGTINVKTENGGLKVIYDGTNDERYENEITNIKSTLSTINAIPVYTVDINGAGDFSSILIALKSTPDRSHIIVHPGEYDMISEYEDYYGSGYFNNYSGYDLSDMYSRGYWITGGRILEFQAGAKVEFRYTGSNTYVGSHFSVFATGYDATIIGGYIDYSGTKYCVHDDAAFDNAGTNTFKNMIIHGCPSAITGMHWGGGCGKKNTYYIDNVVFLDDELPNNYGDLYYHNNESSGAVNQLVINNSYGERSCFFLWMGQSEEISYAIVSGCTFDSIAIRSQSQDAPYENMKLIKFNNTETGD